MTWEPVLNVATITGLTRENDETIGFVVGCLFAGAIDMAELRRWCETVIERNAPRDTPDYLFDILEHDGHPADVFRLIGFVPASSSDEETAAALSGLALRRGLPRGDFPETDAIALAALERRPDVEQRFRETFPFRGSE